MTPRFICPHCHSPIDPQTLEEAVGANGEYRICPECDEATVLFAGRAANDDNHPAPARRARAAVPVAESCIR